MARPLRIEYPGAFYHVMNRGQSRRNIFMENKGRQRFLDLLADIARLKHEEIGKAVGLENTSSVSSAYLLMKERVAKEKRLGR